ncbi:hypothetical protein GN956_G6188 [Arapaima gigas]
MCTAAVLLQLCGKKLPVANTEPPPSLKILLGRGALQWMDDVWMSITTSNCGDQQFQGSWCCSVWQPGRTSSVQPPCRLTA